MLFFCWQLVRKSALTPHQKRQGKLLKFPESDHELQEQWNSSHDLNSKNTQSELLGRFVVRNAFANVTWDHPLVLTRVCNRQKKEKVLEYLWYERKSNIGKNIFSDWISHVTQQPFRFFSLAFVPFKHQTGQRQNNGLCFFLFLQKHPNLSTFLLHSSCLWRRMP